MTSPKYDALVKEEFLKRCKEALEGKIQEDGVIILCSDTEDAMDVEGMHSIAKQEGAGGKATLDADNAEDATAPIDEEIPVAALSVDKGSAMEDTAAEDEAATHAATNTGFPREALGEHPAAPSSVGDSNA